MTVADYIIDFFIKKGVTDVFGYQGGMIAYLFDSIGKRSQEISFHELSSEQGAALAACGYARESGKVGVVLTTSGPGFTNMITGIANAWFDSIPLICISGQVNTKDKKRHLPIRQLGFQEIQAKEITESITKAAYEIDSDSDIVKCLNEAWNVANSLRKGPVFIDLPINMCREEVLSIYTEENEEPTAIEDHDIGPIMEAILSAEKPVIIAGAGINQANARDKFREFAEIINIPVITSMPAIDVLSSDSNLKIGYMGGTARREAGVVLATTDCVLTIGTRLCAKSIGYDFSKFAPNAKLYRVDIDQAEFSRKVKNNETQINMDINVFLDMAITFLQESDYKDFSSWVSDCNDLKKILKEEDLTYGNRFISTITEMLPDKCSIALDVGNNLVYGAQSTIIKKNTKVLISGGLGAMGYALPAAIGATIASGNTACVIAGDGGMQMNIQELNIIGKRRLPIKIIVLNNNALGHILLFQKVYLEERYSGTDASLNDYYSCDFSKISQAYNIDSLKINPKDDLSMLNERLKDDKPYLIELEYEDCSIKPNIHGGIDVLTAGPALSDGVVEKVIARGFLHLE